VRGDLMTGQNGPVWARLALGGAAGSIITRNATDVLWSSFYLAGTAGQTYTFPAVSGTVALGAGTLTAATANDVTIAAHTHAITDTADGAANHSTILSSSAAGAITMDDYFTIDGGTFGITGNELLTVNAAGTFAFSGISGVTVEDADWIGNGAAAALLGFNSAGATDYAYFSNCYVGVGTITPATKLNVNSGQVVIDSIAGFNGLFSTAKFDSQGNAWTTDTTLPALIFNAATTPAQRPEISWYRGGRTYPEFAIREHTTADKGGEIYSGAGTAAPTMTMAFNLGNVGIGISAPLAKTHIDQSAAAGAIPALILDQGDASKQHIVCSMNGADQDFPNILQLDVTGSPALWWDESESAFGFKNITGLLVENGDWIGAGSACAWLYDSGNGDITTTANVGVANTAPNALIDVGNHSGVDPLNSSILINTLRTIGSNARGYVDGTIFDPTGDGYAYASYDIRLRTDGAFDIAHVIGVQGDIRHEGSGTLGILYGFGSMPQVNDGTVTIAYHNYVKDITGAGAVGTQYGLYVSDLAKGGTNWAVYTAGDTDSYFGGIAFFNETANANMTKGITINQGASDNEIFTLKSSDVAHGATNITETDTYFFAAKNDGAAGGARLVGMRDADGDPGWAMHIQGFLAEAADTTHDETGLGVVTIAGHITSGASIANMTADGNVVAFRTYRGGAYESVAIITQAGDIFYDGALTPYDDYDDALAVQDAAHILSGRWNEAITYNAEALAAMGVISLRKDGTPAMVSHKRMTALMAGAIGQLYDRVKQLEQRI